MLYEKDVFRPISWRWQRATQLADANERVGKGDDHWIKDARKYLLHSNKQQKGAMNNTTKKIESRRSEMALFDKYPAIHQAQTMFKECGFYRLITEAYLTAKQTVEQVAISVGLDPEIIAVYEALFFDVRNRLDTVFVVSRLVPRLHQGTMDASDQDTFMKAVAYYQGSGLLDAILRRRLDDPEKQRQIGGMTLQELSMNGTIASMIRSPNQYNAHEVIEETPVFQQLIAHYKALGATPDNPDAAGQIEEASAKITETMNFSLMSAGTPSVNNMNVRVADIIKGLAEGKESVTTDVQTVKKVAPAAIVEVQPKTIKPPVKKVGKEKP